MSPLVKALQALRKAAHKQSSVKGLNEDRCNVADMANSPHSAAAIGSQTCFQSSFYHVASSGGHLPSITSLMKRCPMKLLSPRQLSCHCQLTFSSSVRQLLLSVPRSIGTTQHMACWRRRHVQNHHRRDPTVTGECPQAFHMNVCVQ